MWRGMSCRLHLHSLRGTIIRFALLLSAFLCITQAGYAVDVSFDKDVLPIMQAKCFRCHNQQRAEGSLRLDLKASVLQGGDSGPALIPPTLRTLLSFIEFRPRMLRFECRWMPLGYQLRKLRRYDLGLI